MMTFLTVWFQFTIGLWVLNSLIDARVEKNNKDSKS